MRSAIMIILLGLGAGLPAAEPPRRIVGYVADWSVRPEQVPVERLTHLDYAFALPAADGALLPPPHVRRLDAVAERARAAGVRVLISVGGWGQEKPFIALAADPAARARFVRELLAFVATHRLDGIDMDWEYPQAGAQAEHYAALMHALAEGLRPHGRLLTAAVHAVSSAGIPSSVFADVDFLNLMVYDGDEGAGHAPMAYALAALEHWERRGLPRDKLVLGVPFYARPKYVPWHAIAAAGDAAMQADRWTIAGTEVFYNGIATMRAKAALARQRAGGVMVWELGLDAPGPASLLAILHAAYAGAE
jgi:GH18 family chitinase